jgi:hypothetical protein
MNNLLSNPIVLILLAVGGICFGFLLGFLVRGFFRRGPKEETEASEPEFKPASRNWDEVAHLWSDRRDNRLIFQIENEYYKRDSDLTPKEKKILLKVVMDFYQWLEPSSNLKSETPVAASAPSSPSTVVDSVPLTTMDVSKPELKRIGFNPIQILTQALEADVTVSAIPDRSIVAQIDDILQKKINASNMQKWAVRLVEFPNRGMVVMVGLEQYDEIDAVPYERVQKMIREAVAEWEQWAERNRSE